MAKEPQCAFNLRKFPAELRKRLRMIALRDDEDVQDLVPRWLRERLEQEEGKSHVPSKKPAKTKPV
jgi:hypothetical protein